MWLFRNSTKYFISKTDNLAKKKGPLLEFYCTHSNTISQF